MALSSRRSLSRWRGHRGLLRPEKHQQMQGPGKTYPGLIWNKKKWPVCLEHKKDEARGGGDCASASAGAEAQPSVR